MRDLEWQTDALCAQVSPELFFPEKGDSAEPGRSICRACPVVAECLQFAVTEQIHYGTFGNLSAKQRLDLRVAS